MRKDVKLGFAVGGVLLAVLIVYVSVTSRANRPGINQPGAQTGVVTNAPSGVPTPDAARGADQPTGTGAADPFAPQNSVQPSGTASTGTPQPANHSETASATRDGMDWGKLLNSGPVTTATPDAGAVKPQPVAAVVPAREETANGSKSAPLMIPTFDPGPTTRPISSAKTHIVAQGETLSSISIALFGTPRYFNAIARANPGIDANRLKIGQKLNIPDVSSTKTESKPSDINVGRNEYRVVQGDNLYRISVKLYGKGDRADKIYDLNKQLIGPDRGKLKLNMVLKLPEAPTATR